MCLHLPPGTQVPLSPQRIPLELLRGKHHTAKSGLGADGKIQVHRGEPRGPALHVQGRRGPEAL